MELFIEGFRIYCQVKSKNSVHLCPIIQSHCTRKTCSNTVDVWKRKTYNIFYTKFCVFIFLEYYVPSGSLEERKIAMFVLVSCSENSINWICDCSVAFDETVLNEDVIIFFYTYIELIFKFIPHYWKRNIHFTSSSKNSGGDFSNGWG